MKTSQDASSCGERTLVHMTAAGLRGAVSWQAGRLFRLCVSVDVLNTSILLMRYLHGHAN